MCNAVLGAEPGHGLRFRCRIWSQVMIDRHRQQLCRGQGSVEMVLEEKEKGGRIAAAGYGCNGAVGKVEV